MSASRTSAKWLLAGRRAVLSDKFLPHSYALVGPAKKMVRATGFLNLIGAPASRPWRGYG